MMNGAWASDVSLLPHYDVVKHQAPYSRLKHVKLPQAELCLLSTRCFRRYTLLLITDPTPIMGEPGVNQP
jgi:hypothetical protein